MNTRLPHLMPEPDMSNPDKELFPDITKKEFIEYYERISDLILPHMQKRPLVMYRFPDGVCGETFFQKQVPDYFPDWIDRVSVKKEGGLQQLVVANTQRSLLYLANQVFVPHLWLSTTDDLDRPNRIVFDLDPSRNDFSEVRDAARKIRKMLEGIGLHTFVMTTGGKGLHVIIPIRSEGTFSEVKDFAHKVSQALVNNSPERYTLEHRKNKRGTKIFLDYLRNEYAQTSVSPYAIRAKERAPIATPIGWDELSTIQDAQQYTMKNIFRRLGRKGDAWPDFEKKRKSLVQIRQDIDKDI